MPFNIGGDWIPSPSTSKNTKPVKVRLVKRGKNILTIILNLNMSKDEQTTLSSNIKKKLGCGGAVKDDGIEIQGDKINAVKKYLEEIGIKSS